MDYLWLFVFGLFVDYLWIIWDYLCLDYLWIIWIMDYLRLFETWIICELFETWIIWDYLCLDNLWIIWNMDYLRLFVFGLFEDYLKHGLFEIFCGLTCWTCLDVSPPPPPLLKGAAGPGPKNCWQREWGQTSPLEAGPSCAMTCSARSCQDVTCPCRPPSWAGPGSPLQARTSKKNYRTGPSKRYDLADSCFKSPSKPCNLSLQRKLQGVSVKSLHSFLKVNDHWSILFHHDYQLNYLEWGTCLVEPPIMQGCGTIHIKQVSLESCWLLQYSA